MNEMPVCMDGSQLFWQILTVILFPIATSLSYNLNCPDCSISCD